MKDNYSYASHRNNNNKNRSKLENNSLLSSAIDVLSESNFNLEQGLRIILTTTKYYCRFDFVGYWVYDQNEKIYTLELSSEHISKVGFANCELKEQLLPWKIDEYPGKKYAISVTKYHTVNSIKNNLKLVHESDAHFFALIPIIINGTPFGLLTFSNYKSSNFIPDSFKSEIESLSKILSNTIHNIILIEKQYKYKDLLKISSCWRILLKKPMPVYIDDMQQLNWMYKYGIISTSSNELAKLFGYRDEKVFNEAAVSLNEFMPRNRSNSINFLMNVIKNHHSISNIKSTLIDNNNNEYFYKNNIDAKIISGELMALISEAVLYDIKIANSNSHLLSKSELNLKKSLDFLTNREYEVLLYILGGSQNKLIADEMGICEKTVKVHRGKVMKKLEVCCFAELVRTCDHIGLKPKYISNYHSKIAA